MIQILAKIFSYLFHPLIMTSLGMLILLNSGTAPSVLQPEIKRILFVVTVLFTSVFPASMIIILYIAKMIDSAELQERKERNLPMVLALIMHLFAYFVMRSIPQLSGIHLVFMFCPITTLFVALVFNRFMKPSIHMLGAGVLLGMLMVLILFYGAPIQLIFILAVLAAGILGTSRLLLGLHTPVEVVTGFIIGFLLTLVIMTLHIFTVMH